MINGWKKAATLNMASTLAGKMDFEPPISEKEGEKLHEGPAVTLLPKRLVASPKNEYILFLSKNSFTQVTDLPIISILNPKGGSGKTTITTNLARSLHERGHKVLIVDSDPQGSARDWHAANKENPLPLVALDRANNVKNLPDVAPSEGFFVEPR